MQTKDFLTNGSDIFSEYCGIKTNNIYATAYELRHNYAIENINGWIGRGLGEHMKLLALSKVWGIAIWKVPNIIIHWCLDSLI